MLVFGRAIDSQVLDPVHTTRNADIWLSLNIYDTLLLASADGRGVEPGLAAAWEVSDGGKTIDSIEIAAPDQVILHMRHPIR